MIVTILQQLGWLVVFMFVATAVHNVGSALFCLAGGVKLEEMTFFHGPKLIKVSTRGCKLGLGCIPLGGSVKYDEAAYHQKSRWFRALLCLVGPAFTFALAAALMGLAGAGHHGFTGYSQMVRGPLSPLKEGVPLVHAFFDQLSSSPLTALGIFAAKMTALNLLPLPAFAGGRFLVELFSLRKENPTLEKFTTLSAFFALGLSVGWIVALVGYWRQL